MKELTLSQALEGYSLHIQARRLSPNTVNDYFNTFTKLQDFLGEDTPLCEISKDQLEQFLASFPFKKKTILNYHAGLSALWTWAVAENLVDEHIVRQINPPRPEEMAIIPFTKDDVKLMLYACERSRSYTRPGQRSCTHGLPNPERNKAIILTLLDTGMRASELCGIKIADADLRNGKIVVMGKGSKQRSLPFSSRTGQAIWRYQVTRSKPLPRDPLFPSKDDLPLTSGGLTRLIKRIGQRAGVQKAHPHKFRHTFAINFLRNGGNIYTLQEILGHSTLDMVKRYLKLAEQDALDNHRIASPVSNWGL